jgi:RHS repeat-associated protein
MPLFRSLVLLMLGLLPALIANGQQVVGSVGGQFDVSPLGSASYTIPINLPPGTAGIEPKLALSYDSATPNGPLGFGWSLSGLSAITRCAATLDLDGVVGGVNFGNYINSSTNDRFCLDGQRLISLGGTHGGDGTEYRLKNENFSKVKSYGNTQNGPTHWIVKHKSGLTYEYGATENSRHQLTSLDIIGWHLSKVIDLKGNYYTLSYHQDTSLGELILARIDYTGNQITGLAPYNSIRVVLDAFPGSADSSLNYVSGRRYMSNKDISRLDVYSGDQKVFSYTLKYEYNQILRNNRLIEVEQCDSSGGCLPPTKFTWGPDDPAANSFEETYNYTFSAPNYPNSNLAPVVTGDWNSDGKTDLARVNYYGTHVFLSTGSGLLKQPDIADFGYNGSGYSNSFDYPLFASDFNGDGCTDIGRVSSSGTQVHLSGCDGTFIGAFSHLYNFRPNANQLLVGDWNGDGRADIAGLISSATIRFYISNGSSFSFVNDLGLQSNVGVADDIQTGDWNGDGLTDFSTHSAASGTYFYVSTGSEFNVCYIGNQQTNSSHCFSNGFNGGSGAPILGDWNGDGITDFGKALNSGFKACLSTGKGLLSQCASISAIGLSVDSDLTQRPIFAADFNGDGFTDIARVQTGGIRIFYARMYHDGTFFFEETTALPNFGSNQGYSSDQVAPLTLGDWNGDGHNDIGRTTSTGFFLSNHRPHDVQRIMKIEDGIGKIYTINYSALTNPTIYTKYGSLPFPMVDLQSAFKVVSSFSVSDGLGAETVTSYKYTGLTYNLAKRAIGGFHKIESKDHESNITSSTWYSQTSPFEGLPYRSEVRLSNGTLISKKEDIWSSITTFPGVVFPYASQNVESRYELNGSLTSTVTTTHTFDAYGNQTQVETTRSDGSSETTVSTYDNDTTNWLLGQLKTSTVTKVGSGTPTPPALTKRVAFNYLPNTGLLSSELIEPGSQTLELVKSYQYDPFGNITQKTLSGVGIQPRTETTLYDSRGQFPLTITNALGQTETRITDPKFGKVTSLTGPNGITTTWQYDGFGRATLEQRADGTSTITYYELPSASAPINAAYQVRTSSTGSPDSITYLDELSREIRKEATGFNGQKILIDKVYDERGLLTHVSDPYFDGTSLQWTVTEYDEIGRTTTIIQPGNRVTQTTYNGLTTTIVNPLNQTATQTVDAQGFVLSATDNQGNSLTFKNDSYGNPIEIRDPLNNTTIIEYDLQGKKTRLVDPDTGITTYTYNALGELLTQRDALNIVTSFSYDLLGRMLQRTSPDGVESWQYDTALNGIGKLALVTGLNGYSESYEYDVLGRLFKTTTNVSGKNFVTSLSYDSLSRVDTYSYPSSFTLRNIYNSLGYLSEIQRADLNTSVWKANAFNAKGQIEQQTYGNGLVSNKIYDPNTNFLTHTQTNGAQVNAVQDLTFVYDALGNLTERQDLRVGVRESFTYDSLNRLKTATVFGQSPLTINYDQLGNITSRSDVGSYTYGVGAGPHAVTSISGPKANTYSYDLAGNRISSNDGTVQYSSSGKPISISKGAKRVEFDLNPQDQRIEERVFSNNALTERKVYIGGLYESVTKGARTTNTHYIRGADGLVAVLKTTDNVSTTGGLGGSGSISIPGGSSSSTSVSGVVNASSAPRSLSTMRYLHLDHLGSVQTITDASGSVVEVLSFDPWGKRRDATSWTPSSTVKSSIDKGFTGHEHLDEVDLIHMNGRVYDPAIGRFISADPFIQSSRDLQSYNRYSYVLNNPLSLTDPSGYFSFKKFWKSFKQVAKVAIVIGVAYYTGGAFSAWLGNGFFASGNGTHRGQGFKPCLSWVGFTSGLIG